MTYTCPFCGQTAIEAASAIGATQDLVLMRGDMVPGCLAMCRHCAELLEFDEAMDLVMPTLDTLNQLTPAQSQMIDLAKARIREVGPRKLELTPGDRIGAVLSCDLGRNKVEVLGFGVYEGHFVPPKEIAPRLNDGTPNPRIKLDNGKTVWGLECWWGIESEMREIVSRHKTIVTVDIDEVRRKANERTKTTGQNTKTGPEESTSSPDSYRAASNWRWSR